MASESSEALIARGICPVKPQYLRQQTRVVQEAVTGSGSGVAADAAKAKSKSQFRQERNNQKQNDLCINLVQNKCIHGAQCRYSHDVEGYLAAKPADLHGRCPFSSLSTCPYGISCRWAGSHTYSDPMQDRLMKQLQQQQQQQEVCTQGQASAPEPVLADATGASEDGASEQLQQQQQQGEAALQRVELPVSEQVDKVMNAMEKEVQNKLWKNRYDFGRADGVLKQLGLRVTLRGGNDKGGKNKQNKQQQQQQQQQVQQEAGPEPELKRQKTAAGDAGGGDTDMAAAQVGEPEGVAAGQPGVGQGSAAALPAPEAEAAAGAAGSAAGLDVSAAALPAPAAEAAAGGAACLDAPAAASSSAAAAGAAGAAAPAPRESAAAVADSSVYMHVETRLRPEEKKTLDFRGKTYLAPLTTVGNLPFRRVCKGLGADITCGEMALATNLLQGQASEWALLKRHPCEDFFGVQVCGGFPDALARTAQLIDENATVDFVDVNMGCPIDLVCDRSAGSALLLRPKRIEEIARCMSRAMDCPLTLKTRKGYYDGKDIAHTLIPSVQSWGAVALTLHGRTRQQRYSRQADWQYIGECAELAPGLQLIGNGDVFSYEDWNAHMAAAGSSLSSCMIGRGGLIKPWLFTEIKEQRHWDISASERLDLMKRFCSFGLEHWGADSRGVENTRRFLLEWQSYLCRYVPVGLLEVIPQQLHWRPPAFTGRNELETLLGSDSAADWVKISEMLLGPVPQGFVFTAKHKSSSYAASSEPGAADEQAQG